MNNTSFKLQVNLSIINLIDNIFEIKKLIEYINYDDVIYQHEILKKVIK